MIYQAETDFGRIDLYRGLARALGLEPAYRRAPLWRDLKARIHELADTKQMLPVWIIDEAQNLPAEFFRDFPAFLNFAFDSRDLMTRLAGRPSPPWPRPSTARPMPPCPGASGARCS